MKTTTVTSSGRVLDYIAIHIIDDQGVFLNDWMMQVGLVFVPIPDPERCTASDFKPEELQTIRGGGRGGTVQRQQPDPLVPKKLIEVPDLYGAYGGILVLVELFADPPIVIERESEEEASVSFVGARKDEREWEKLRRHRRERSDLVASPCTIRAPYSEREWIDFFEKEWGFRTYPPVQKNQPYRNPDWAVLVSNAGCVLAILPQNKGFEIACGYRVSETSSTPRGALPPAYQAYRYDNVNGKLIRKNSIAEVGVKLKSLERFYRHAELTEVRHKAMFRERALPPKKHD